jgi:hypothetical protein
MDDDDDSEVELVMAPPDEADRSAVVSAGQIGAPS